MDRRTFLCGLMLGTVSAPLAAEAQPAEKVWRIGVLRSGPDGNPEFDGFRAGLRELGYREGQNVILHESRAKRVEELPAVAAELVGLKVDVIVASGTPATTVAREAITTTPVVFVTFADPVRTGLVASLAKPGRNMTGMTMIAAELVGKRLELLKEALPKANRVALLWNPANRDTEEQLNQTRTAARSLGLQIDAHAAQTPEDLNGAFAAIARTHADAFFVLSDPMFGRERWRIASLAERNRLPGIYHWRTYVDAGGLMSYGPNLTELFRRAAVYVDKILRGAKPADLPVEQPTKFELVLNMKTAKALGLTIPPSLLARADQVIE